MPSLDRNLPLRCNKCIKMAVKKIMARHKQSCDNGVLFCPKCPHFSTKKKEDMNYDIAKHHAPKDTKLSTVCTVCLRSFRVSILFNDTGGESTELQQKLGQNRVKSLKKF